MKAIDNPEIKQWVMDCGIMASRIGRERLLDIIDAHTAKAVLAEREACAMVCVTVPANTNINTGVAITRLNLAQKIRARGEV